MEEEREHFRAKLTAMQSEILAISESAAQDLKPVMLDQTSVGLVSRVDAMQLQQMSQEAARRRQQLLAKIEGALRRIESGCFGLCFLCKVEIDLRRLNADPTLTRSRDCVENAQRIEDCVTEIPLGADTQCRLNRLEMCLNLSL